ncbi:hypothetical protein [Microbacterium immunditiarum]|uniref:Uncharacterized protein n=1 Tax=Microbacterium immunditiarum TaxID=337480 RepID=A0A7Y9KGY6_9MICO|nr:hypothetical protein [Microbacterium immunditiarum]NYE18952.1 hypothetical protein [Microbacterium immunditiarum]
MTDTPDRREPVAPTERLDASTYDRDTAAGRYDGDVAPAPRTDDPALRNEVLAREEERFGGFKFGSAFFGWIAAMGLALLLTALIAAIGGAIGAVAPDAAENAVNTATDNMGVTTIIGAIALALVLFISYFAGGYVAGRMARFSGVKQGLAVWLWAIIIAVIVAVVTAVGGAQWDILGALGGFPRIPVTPETATTAGILTAVGAAIVTLAGALLGGAAGMRYHRRVDREGFGI